MKTVVPFHVLLKPWSLFSSGVFDEYKVQKNSIYLKYKIFNIINVLLVTFDQFNVS